MAERSFSQLPISSSHIFRRTGNTRKGIFPVSEHWIHAIPVIVFLCFFTLWIFSHSVRLDMNDGEITSIHRLVSVRNESHVSLAILASSAITPVSSFVSTDQNLTVHYNVTESINSTQSEDKTNQTLIG